MIQPGNVYQGGRKGDLPAAYSDAIYTFYQPRSGMVIQRVELGILGHFGPLGLLAFLWDFQPGEFYHFPKFIENYDFGMCWSVVLLFLGLLAFGPTFRII